MVDRKKDMIISGGENIYSWEVEEALRHHPAVAEAAVIAVPDPEWGEAVKACVVLREGMRAGQDELIAHCRTRIASYKKPRSVEFVAALPRLFNGKIDKKACAPRIGPAANAKFHKVSGSMQKFEKFRTDNIAPRPALPADSCDCQFHVFGDPAHLKARGGLTHPFPDATVDAALAMHRAWDFPEACSCSQLSMPAITPHFSWSPAGRSAISRCRDP